MSLQISSALGLSPAALLLFVGSVHIYPATVAPRGSLPLSGQLLSRTTYSALYAYAAASGNMAASDAAWTSGQFSPGDGSTTFRVPEYRGEFPRFWDNGRGVDSGRGIGAAQADAMKLHTHGLNGAIQDDGGTVYNITSGGRGSAATATGTNAGGISNETRVRNVALLACIFTGVA